MFLPKEMTEIELVVPDQDLLAVANVLAGQGVFHQVDAANASPEVIPGSASSWQEQATAYAALERQLQATVRLLGVEEGSAPPPGQSPMVEIEAVRPLVEHMAREVREVNDLLEADRKRLEQLNGYLRQLEPVAGIPLDISALQKSRYIFSILGVIPVVNLERLKTSLARIPFVVLPLRQDRQHAVVWLAGTRQNADTLKRAARSAYLNPLNLPDVQEGTPSEIIRSLHVAIGRAQEHLGAQEAAIVQLRRTREEELQVLLWRTRASRMLSEAMARFGRLRYTYLIVGWVPTGKWAALSERLRQASKNILVQAHSGARSTAGENVPVSLGHRGVLRPFQQLVTMFARPRYNELDPTFLMALTFPLLFGAMFGDVGHGLELALLGVLLSSRKVRALRGLAGLGGLITVCGVAGCLFGFLYGSVFGLDTILPALWIRPIDNILEILYISVGAGIVLLSAGFLLNIYNAGLTRDWPRLFLDRNGVTGLVLYWSLLGLAAASLIAGFPVPPAVFAVSAALSGLAVMFSEVLKRLTDGRRPLVEGGLGTYAIQTVFEMFDTLIAMLSNSLSYVRVGAFAVAHAGLSSVFFILAVLISPGHGAGYWIMVLIGNLFIVGFEGLIVGIQTMRLEYYEFFSKFFLGGGMPYSPLTLRPKVEE
jgi:V/A-type H+-transporting ATPase subunit I